MGQVKDTIYSDIVIVVDFFGDFDILIDGEVQGPTFAV